MANQLNLDWNILKDTFEGDLDPDKQAYYDRKVDEAVRLLLRKCPGLLKKVEDGELDPEFVSDTVAKAVLRVIRNPEGFTNESEGNYSYGLGARVASGDIWYPDNELDALGCGGSSSMVPRSVRVKLGW